MKDIVLLSAEFITCDLPKHKEYLYKYFRKEQIRIVIYYLMFPYPEHTNMAFKRFYTNFTDHTGLYITERWAMEVVAKLKIIEAAMAEAENKKDHETIAKIKMGT